MDRVRDAEKDLEEIAPQISQAARKTLVRMYAADVLDGTEEKGVAVGPERISIRQGAELNKALRSIKASRTLEIDFAYGFQPFGRLTPSPP